MTREELLNQAKPILFNTEMVKAILEGRKTVTRRIVKFPVNRFINGVPNQNELSVLEMKPGKVNFHQEPFFSISVKTPFKAGDYLYVRETWTDWSCSECEDYECENCIRPVAYLYKADGEVEGIKWKPSLHMPKEAARLFLKVTNVRVERLQDITEEQAKAEGANVGISWTEKLEHSSIERFQNIWNSTIKKQDLDKYGWKANPWVFVIEFEKANA